MLTDASRMTMRSEGKKTIEAAAYASYVHYCEKIGIKPLSLEEWRHRARQAFRARTDPATFESH